MLNSPKVVERNELLTLVGINTDNISDEVLVQNADQIGTMVASVVMTGGGVKSNAEKNKNVQQGPMLGANGVQVASKTIWKGKERIDVENPNSGQRTGQIHYQNNKYYYDPKRFLILILINWTILMSQF